jgi:aryl-alcohol dehydrogenase-like predicted oxidoreductase
MFDSADIYSDGMAEEILGTAIKGRREQVILSTKGGQRVGAGTERRDLFSPAADRGLRGQLAAARDGRHRRRPDPCLRRADAGLRALHCESARRRSFRYGNTR